jgi:hypothetical protein
VTPLWLKYAHRDALATFSAARTARHVAHRRTNQVLSCVSTAGGH